MQDYFYALADAMFSKLGGDEQLLLDFSGEDSDFVRLNHNRIRQAGYVAQRRLSLDLIEETGRLCRTGKHRPAREYRARHPKRVEIIK